MSTEAPGFTAGQEVTWTGTRGLFSRRVRIVEARRSYLKILGETPEDARVVYDIADIKTGKILLFAATADELAKP
jgi:hypothetical protein